MTTSGYQIAVIDGPDLFPVTLAEAKKQCRIDADITEEDDLIQEWIETATELAEDYCKRSFVERVLEVTFDDFPRAYEWPDNRLVLPMGPVLEVLEFGYTQYDGTVISYPSDQFSTGFDGDQGYVLSAFGTWWPLARCGPGAVRIRYRAGYASAGSPADASRIPKKVKQAVRMLVGHWYANRESVATDTRIIPADMPYSFERLLDPLKVYP